MVDASTRLRGFNMGKRDSSYYLARLKSEKPKVYRDYLAGAYPSVNAALRAAGLKKSRTPLHELKNAWMKASVAERSAFVKWLKTGTRSASATVVAVDRRLTHGAKHRIAVIMDRRRLKMGDVMRELGFKPLNASLGRALLSGTRIQQDLIAALESWLIKNSSV